MPRQLGKLAAAPLEKRMKPGLHSDGGGLYLRVKSAETGKEGKFWAFRFMLHGKAREMGLGALHTLTLAEARQKATDCRKLLIDGIDPINARDDASTETRLAAARSQTFKQCAEAYIEAHKAGWRNAKHSSQWTNTLTTYVYPIFGNLPVQDIDVALITKALEQKSKAYEKGQTLWTARPETASRLRGRIELILDWATAREYRRGENPARWRGHLENLLPRRSKVQRIEHQPALPYDQIGDFVAALKNQEGTAAQAMVFTILTAARTSETIGAAWDEIDLNNKVWTVPATRIKGGREHRVPLSESALRILKELKKQRDLIEQKKDAIKSKWVFTGQKRSKPMSNMAMLALLKRMKRTDITVHGFRSTFRDWAAEQTHFPREVAESSLAHVSGDKVEASYLRTDFFEKRRRLMDAWAEYCGKPSPKSDNDNVVPMQARRRRAKS